jgi:acylphosphatase
MPTVQITISGRVQGVNFRAATRDFAARLALTGWIRNTRDGNVELAATGPEPALKQLITWCHHGPPLAVVSDVSIKHVPETRFEGFEIRRG